MLRGFSVLLFICFSRLAAAQVVEGIPAVNPSGQEGEQVAQAPTIVEQVFQDWVYRCQLNASGRILSCEVSQRVFIQQGDKTVEVLKLAIIPADDKARRVGNALIIRAPVDVHLPSDFGLQFGNQRVAKSRYRNCNALGCWVVIPANSKVLSGMKRSVDGSARFRLLNGQVLKVVFSLRGFTRAYNAYSSGVFPQAVGAME